jgi:hypothetical protein
MDSEVLYLEFEQEAVELMALFNSIPVKVQLASLKMDFLARVRVCL